MPKGAAPTRLADQALDNLKTAGVDIYGTKYKPITVKVTAGGK